MTIAPHPMPSVTQALNDALSQGLARVDAQMLLLHALGQPTHARAWLITHDSDVLSAEQAERWQELLRQRLAGVPVAYLTGHKAFFGLDLQVDARVLDPRPDTETLVEWALDVIATLPAAPSQTNKPRVLDLGTGSGAIALAIAHTAPQVQVYALDASADALAVAQANAQRLGLNVPMRQSNWLAALPDWLAELADQAGQVDRASHLPADQALREPASDTPARLPTSAQAPTDPDTRFALIVSNPPYIRDDDEHMPALVHEPRQALTSGADGLDDIRHIVREARAWLAPGAWLLLEHGWDQHEAVQALLREAGYDEVQSRLDLADTPRCTGGRWPG